MAFEPVPYAISGEQLSANMLRRQLYKLTRGRSGISLPDDLKVTPTPTPGAAVRIAPGGGTAANKFPGGDRQSYDVTANSATDVAVTATGASAATRQVIVRIYDHQFAGSKPTDGIYVKPVIVSVLPTDYPFIWLATITQPANTGTITAAMIKDRRTLVSPASPEMNLRVSPVATAHNLTSTTTVNFPNVAETILIPDWANYCVISAQVGGMQIFGGPIAAEFHLFFNNLIGQYTTIDEPGTASGYARLPSVLMKWESPVGNLAGTEADIRIRARKISGAGTLRADNYTQLVFNIQFTEAPV